MQITRKRFFDVVSRAATGSAVVTALGPFARAEAAADRAGHAPSCHRFTASNG